MKIEYTICDRCGKSIPDATGAVLLIYGGRPQAHLCEACLAECLRPPSEKIVEHVKGVEWEKCP